MSGDVVSLWATLHDGIVEQVSREGSRVELVIDVPHVRHHAGLPETSRFRLVLDGVAEPRVVGWEPPPRPRPPLRDRAAHDAWVAEGARPPVATEQLVADLAAPGGLLGISDGELASSEAQVLLRIAGMLEPAQVWRDVTIEARSLEIHEGSRVLALDAFIALGEAYWDDFERRRSAPT